MKIIASKEVAVLKEKQITKTASGLLAAQYTGRDKQSIGVIVELGPGKPPVPCKKGDTVVFKNYVENEVDIPEIGEVYNFIEFKNIMAVLKT